MALEEDAAAVPGLAPPTAGTVKVAAGPGPNTGCFCAGVYGQAPGLARVEAPTAPRHGPRPNRVRTAVMDVENGCAGGGEEEESGENEGGNGDGFEVAHFEWRRTVAVVFAGTVGVYL